MSEATHNWDGIVARYLCPTHRWTDTATLGSDDARLTCDVCGSSGYHVKPVPHWFRAKEG